MKSILRKNCGEKMQKMAKMNQWAEHWQLSYVNKWRPVIQRIADDEKITSMLLCVMWGTTAAVWVWTQWWRNRRPSSQTGELGHEAPLKSNTFSPLKLGNRRLKLSDDMKKCSSSVLLLHCAMCISISPGTRWHSGGLRMGILVDFEQMFSLFVPIKVIPN